MKTALTTLICIAALLGNVQRCRGQKPLGGLVLGAVLDKLMSQVKEAEEKAIGGGMVLEIGAGGEVASAIEQAKTAYAGSLQLTVSQLGAADQQVVGSLQSLADDFIRKSYGSASKLEDKAMGIVHNLPFSKDFPQVFRFRPNYVAIDQYNDSTPVEVTLEGDFLDLPREGYDPVLTVGGQTIRYAGKGTNFVQFKVPKSAFTASNSAVSTTYVSVDVPYEKTTLEFIHSKADTQFVFPVVTLPKSLGSITVQTTSSHPGVARQQVVSPELTQQSGDDDIKDGGEHADLAIHRWPPAPGWRVIPSSVTYRMNRSQGKQGVDQDWWFSRNISTLNEAVLCFSTEHHGAGTSGKIWFNIVFTEEKDVTNTQTANQSVALPWGGSRVVEVPAGATWKGRFDRFDGKSFEFSGPFHNEFINVSQAGPVITLSAIP